MLCSICFQRGGACEGKTPTQDKYCWNQMDIDSLRQIIHYGRKNPHVFIPRSHHLMHLPKAIAKGWGSFFVKQSSLVISLNQHFLMSSLNLKGHGLVLGLNSLLSQNSVLDHPLQVASGHEEPKPNVTKKFATIQLSATIFKYCLRGGIHATIKQPHSREEI